MARPPLRPGKPTASASSPSAANPQEPSQPGGEQGPQQAAGKDPESQPASGAAEIDPHTLPPRPAAIVDILFALLNPAPMFAYHSGDRRLILPVTLCEFAALCLWCGATGASFGQLASLSSVSEAFDTFIREPLLTGWRVVSNDVSKLAAIKSFKGVFIKEVGVLAAIVLHGLVCVAALIQTFFSSKNQDKAAYVLRPVHWTDFGLLLVDDSTVGAMHSPNRGSMCWKSVLRVIFVFNYLPQAVVSLFLHGENSMSVVNWIMLIVHAGFAGFSLWQHMQSAGYSSIF